jgi:hypothetical protein
MYFAESVCESLFLMKGKKYTDNGICAKGIIFSHVESKATIMTLTIVLIILGIAGFVWFGYSMNKSRSVNKQDAMKQGREMREHGDSTH